MDRKSLHCCEMNHHQVAYFSRVVGQQPHLKLFAFVSKKETLGSYKSKISGDHQAQFYYNKCAQLLLEQVGSFLREKKILKDQLSIVFEERSGHDYDRLRTYLKKIIANPIDNRSIPLAQIDPLSITSMSKNNDPLLSFADLTAHAVYQAVNFTSTNYGLADQRYLRELSNKFYCNPETKCIGDFGLKMMKWREMGLDEISYRYFSKLHGIRS